MTYPITAVVRPSSLVSASNGALPADQLVDVVFAGVGTGRLHRQTARAWKALVVAVKAQFGVTLTVTSLADAYRIYAIQKSAFLTRMEPVSYATYLLTSTSRRRRWSYMGQTYWRLRPGFAACATPGTSNHGWGLALDVQVLFADGTKRALYGSVVWSWLLVNAVVYGFSWESDETWHLRYFAGDATPAAVLKFEQAAGGWPIFNPAVRLWGWWPIVAPKPVLQIGSKGDAVRYLQGVLGVFVDGDFGVQTATAVSGVQAFVHLPATGTVDAAFWQVVDQLATR